MQDYITIHDIGLHITIQLQTTEVHYYIMQDCIIQEYIALYTTTLYLQYNVIDGRIRVYITFYRIALYLLLYKQKVYV